MPKCWRMFLESRSALGLPSRAALERVSQWYRPTFAAARSEIPPSENRGTLLRSGRTVEGSGLKVTSGPYETWGGSTLHPAQTTDLRVRVKATNTRKEILKGFSQ